MNIMFKIPGLGHPETIAVMTALAWSYWNLKQQEEGPRVTMRRRGEECKGPRRNPR